MSDLTDPNKRPERTPDMEDHQLWVWLAGATPPQWKIFGTGLVFNIEQNYDTCGFCGWNNCYNGTRCLGRD